MKILNEKKGFTLIELLAVIVILAIVAVIGYSTVLPLLEKARRNAFATQANNVLDAAQTAFTAYNLHLDTGSDPSKTITTGSGASAVTKWCYLASGGSGTTKDLYQIGALTKELKSSEWKGYVMIEKSGEIYTYKLYLTNAKYSVSGVAQADADNLSNASTSIANTCPNS